MDKRFAAILVVIVVVLGGIFFWSRPKHNTSNSNTKAGPSQHTIGQNSKNVTLIEYGDFQCPACGQYYPLVKQVKEKYNQDIKFQFRHFPLIQIHPNAMLAARAAEAAGLQNKFWEMHDMLYEQQTVWTSSKNAKQVFEGFAQQLGLNMAKFQTDAASQAVLDTINADIKQAQAAGGTGTPTFVLDGKKIEESPGDLDAFSKLIDEAIAHNKTSSVKH